MNGPTFCVKLTETLATRLAQASMKAGVTPDDLATMAIASAVGTVEERGHWPLPGVPEPDSINDAGEPRIHFELPVDLEFLDLVRRAAQVLRLEAKDVFNAGAKGLADHVLAHGSVTLPLQITPTGKRAVYFPKEVLAPIQEAAEVAGIEDGATALLAEFAKALLEDFQSGEFSYMLDGWQWSVEEHAQVKRKLLALVGRWAAEAEKEVAR